MVTNESSLSQDWSQLTHQAHEAAQRVGLASDPVPGDPELAASGAEHLLQLGRGYSEVAAALHRLDTGSWTGQAASGFRARFGGHEQALHAAGQAFTTAGQALQDYVQVLAAQQSRGQHAHEQLQAAEAASSRATWQHNAAVVAANLGGPPPPPIHDPGQAQRAAAQPELDAARAAVQQAGDLAASRVQQAVQAAANLPPDPAASSNTAAVVGAAASTVGHVASGIVDFAVDTSKTGFSALSTAGWEVAATVNPLLRWTNPEPLQQADRAVAGAGHTAAQVSTVAAGAPARAVLHPVLRWTNPEAARWLDRQVSSAAAELWTSQKTAADVDQLHYDTGRGVGTVAPLALGGEVAGAGRVAATARGAEAGELAASSTAESAPAVRVPAHGVDQPQQWGRFPDSPTQPGLAPHPAPAGHPEPAHPGPHPELLAPSADHGPGMVDGAANSDHPAAPPPAHGGPEPPSLPGDPPPGPGARPEAHPAPPPSAAALPEAERQRLISAIDEGTANESFLADKAAAETDPIRRAQLHEELRDCRGQLMRMGRVINGDLRLEDL